MGVIGLVNEGDSNLDEGTLDVWLWNVKLMRRKVILNELIYKAYDTPHLTFNRCSV